MAQKNEVRLACSECDCDDEDFITEQRLEECKVAGWEDITWVQSYEDSTKTYDNRNAEPENYSVRDWYTHIGLCPDCKAFA